MAPWEMQQGSPAGCLNKPDIKGHADARSASIALSPDIPQPVALPGPDGLGVGPADPL